MAEDESEKKSGERFRNNLVKTTLRSLDIILQGKKPLKDFKQRSSVIRFAVWVSHSVVLDLKKTKPVVRPNRRLCGSIRKKIEESKPRQWYWTLLFSH